MTNVLIPSKQDTLNRMISVYTAGLLDLGATNVSVDPGSDIYLEFSTIINEMDIAQNNLAIIADSLMPDTATGTDLDRICQNVGIFRRPAATATGFIQIQCNQSTTVLAGTQLISPFGLLYSVNIGGTYNNNDIIQVTSVDAGSFANLSGGTALTWVDLPAFTNTTALVSLEIAGGTDTEDDDTLRQRYFSWLQNPPRFGKWSDVALLTENFNTQLIQKAFVYSCANGPGTQHIAVIAYQADDPINKNRNIDSTTLTNLTNYVIGNLPAYTNTVLNTVDNDPTDVSFQMTLPFPIGAVNLGTGGGWTDYTPWPFVNSSTFVHDGVNNFSFCFVSSVVNSNRFVVNAPSGRSPTPNINQIAWIDRSNNWTVRTATILVVNSVVGSSYDITIDNPFSGISTNDHIFPNCESAQIYVDTVLSYFAQLGPGEKNTVSSLSSRAQRQPLPIFSFKNTIDSTLLKQLEDSGQEVFAAKFSARRFNGSDFGNNAPPSPNLISSNPQIWVPKNISFYPTIQ